MKRSESPPPPAPRLAPAWIRVILVLVLFHLFAALRPWPWDKVSIQDSFWWVSPDLWVLLAVASLLCLRFGYRWYFGHVFVLALLWVPLLRAPEVFFPYMQGKQFVLVDDLAFVMGLGNALFAGDPEAPSTMWIILGIAAGLAVLWTIFYLLWRFIGRRLTNPRLGGATLVGAVLVLLASFVEKSLEPTRASRALCESMFGSTLRQANHYLGTAALQPRVEFAQAQLEKTPQDLGGLQSADLIVVFVESYGRNLFQHPRYGALLRQDLEKTTASLRAAGHGVVSSWIESPVTGGQSHVAHASFMSGIPLESSHDHEALLASDARMLTHILGDLGYHCVNVQPKLEIEWPDSQRVLGFHEDLFGVHTPYRKHGGMIYHWAAAPDQYHLALAMQNYMKSGDKPVFLQLVACVSHAPFSKIPPYISDWNKALDPKAYQPVKTYPYTIEFYHGAEGVEEAYLATLRYTFEMLVGYVDALPRPALLLVLGDHQAPRTGSIAPDVVDYAVPLHVISNRPELLAPMRARGGSDSMIPTGAEATPMHEFLFEFLKAYHRR